MLFIAKTWNIMLEFREIIFFKLKKMSLFLQAKFVFNFFFHFNNSLKAISYKQY